jgi:hypothetical protein
MCPLKHHVLIQMRIPTAVKMANTGNNGTVMAQKNA